jgi:hypothetical protein
MARMTRQRVAELRGDIYICSIGTTLKAETNDEVHAPLGVDTMDAKCLILAFICQLPAIMKHLCKVISFCMGNLHVYGSLQEELENIKFWSHPFRKGLDRQNRSSTTRNNGCLAKHITSHHIKSTQE